MMKIYFVSSSEKKYNEIKSLFPPHYQLEFEPTKLYELQCRDVNDVLKNKAMEAFKITRRPTIVEHTCLILSEFDSFPGTLTESIWIAFGEERFSKLFSQNSSQFNAEVCSYIEYCDGRNFYQFEGKIKGRIVYPPRGNPGFGWDRIFQPETSDKTFAEMDSNEKNEQSMRQQSVKLLIQHLDKTNSKS